MKVFYDEHGNEIGHIDAGDEALESNMEVVVTSGEPVEIDNALPLTSDNYVFVNGQLVPINENN